MPLKFPDSADSADLAAAGYSQVIILGGGTDTVSTSTTADYLLLAGGGGGGGVIDGGGGAGGYRTTWGTGADGSGGYSGGNSSLETALTLNSGTAYSITVGQGGEGGLGWNAAANMRGHKGRTTSISGSDITTVTTTGGGGGKGFNYQSSTEKDGGSGGGGAYSATDGGAGGSGTTGQGFDGGTSGADVGSGGGGAGAAGVSATVTTAAGDGGDGLASTITGTSVTRAGGGGGGIRASSGTTNGIGGAGGGGDGGVNTVTRLAYGTVTTEAATSGRPLYGGGGGGGGFSQNNATISKGGNGGSGIAIFRLPSTLTYSASQLSSDISNDSNCTASYLNTQVYTNDTNFSSVSLLLNGEGSSIIDRSSNIATVTTFGNTHVDTTVKKFGSGSIEFDGSGDYITATSSFGFAFGTGDFTIETWVKFRNGASDRDMTLFDNGTVNTAGHLAIFADVNNLYCRFGTSGATLQTAWSTLGMSNNNWNHLAIVRDNGTCKVFVNGVLKNSGTRSENLTANGCRIGTLNGYGSYYDFDGYLDDFRITKGVARYTSSFTPPTSALTNTVSSGTVDLRLNGDGTNNQTTFTDQSASPYTITTFGDTHVDTSVYKFGGGAIEFDGNGDYLRTSDFGLTSGDFTIEAWVRLKAMPTTDTWPGSWSNWMEIVGVGTFNLADGWQFRIGQTQLAFGTNADTTAVTGTHGMSTGTWYHLAVTRSGNVYTVYVDGSSVGSATYTAQQPGSGAYGWIGTETGQGAYLNGYIDDLRITKGAAIYNSNFTPPTSAFPNPETSTGGDHVITFTVTTEDPHDGGATTNDGTATWTPTLSTPTPGAPTTWTIPEGVDSFSIMAIGAGGAAGYSDSTSAGGGGGGGGLAYLNNIAVTQGNQSIQSITVGGGQLGIGGESDGGDATDLTVTMNLSSDPIVNLSGYTLNPYGQDSHDSDFFGIMFIGANRAYDSDIFDSYPTLNLNFDDSNSSTADQFVYVQPTGPFGAGAPSSIDVFGNQKLFEIQADANYTYIQSLAENDPNTTNRWGYNNTTRQYSADSLAARNVDWTGRNALDSSQYYDSDIVETFFLQNTWPEMYKSSVLGTIDSIGEGTGLFTTFLISSNALTAQFNALPGQSPYVDSNGQIIISGTGDPFDFNGFGPQDLNQILIIKNLTP